MKWCWIKTVTQNNKRWSLPPCIYSGHGLQFFHIEGGSCRKNISVWNACAVSAEMENNTPHGTRKGNPKLMCVIKRVGWAPKWKPFKKKSVSVISGCVPFWREKRHSEVLFPFLEIATFWSAFWTLGKPRRAFECGGWSRRAKGNPTTPPTWITVSQLAPCTWKTLLSPRCFLHRS